MIKNKKILIFLFLDKKYMAEERPKLALETKSSYQ